MRGMIPPVGIRLACLLALLATACGGSPVGPTPTTITASGTLTDTVSGAPIGSYRETVTRFPARLTLSIAGHLQRDVEITAAGQTVDLIPTAAPFDLEFYRQFARGTLENASPQTLRVLSAAPSIYLQTTGLSAANVAALEQAARLVIPALTGERFQVQTWETGAAARAEQAGWIVVELVNDDAKTCGLANIGATAGHIWLNTIPRCGDGHQILDPGVFLHELGHALGFWHVSTSGSVMLPNVRRAVMVPALDRYHAAIAYHRTAGNRDLDVDP